jgi:hypothetical protein
MLSIFLIIADLEQMKSKVKVHKKTEADRKKIPCLSKFHPKVLIKSIIIRIFTCHQYIFIFNFCHMKTIGSLAVFLVLVVFPWIITGQTSYTYPLTTDFSPVQAGGPELIEIPNNGGQYGQFTTRTVPASTCGQGGPAGGYFFPDDGGLQFNSPAGFINESYSLALNFQFDEFISPPGWVRLLSFTHYDDVGMYIKLTNSPTNGTLEFWPYGTAGEWDFFNTTDFYQMILVRNASGVITVYINGQEFATYDDSETQAFVPKDPDNFIVFFRDDPSVLEGEASPGFVSSIIIRNLNWTPAEVQAVWENFCSSLLNIPEDQGKQISVFPNPSPNGIFRISVPDNLLNSEYILRDATGRAVLEGSISEKDCTIDIGNLHSGAYFLLIKGEGEITTLKLFKN